MVNKVYREQKQKWFNEGRDLTKALILHELQKGILTKEKLKESREFHKELGEYGRGYCDCEEQSNDFVLEVKQRIEEDIRNLKPMFRFRRKNQEK